MPKQLMVADVGLVSRSFLRFVHSEDVLDLDPEVVVGGGVSVLDVSDQPTIEIRVVVNGLDGGLEAEIIRVDFVDVSHKLSLAQDLGVDLNILQGLEHLKLLLDFPLGVQRKVLHLNEPEVMRNVGVKIARVLLKLFFPLLPFHFF